MKIRFAKSALEDYQYWRDNDPKLFDRIHVLLRQIKEAPFSGIGKPEPLKGSLSGFWSRRINIEHRLVYKVSGSSPQLVIFVIQCRYHY
ncbi:MAG: Txe/YoeB family addiction module toxin [Leeuwenhoekiella sp.]